MNKNRYIPHPGVYIKDAIEDIGITQTEFASRLGLTSKNLSTLISGESNITFDVAVKLANYFGNSIEGWINLQTKYEMYKNEEIFQRELKEEWKIVKLFDKEFIKQILNKEIVYSFDEKIIILFRKIFNVSSLLNLKRIDLYASYKASSKKELSEENIILRNAWISLADQYSRDIKCSPFNKNELLKHIQYLRKLTLKGEKAFNGEIQLLLEAVGVKLVILPYLKNSNISGVTKRNPSNQTVMIAINDFNKSNDNIWFTLFHELGHAVKNHKRNFTISFINSSLNDKDEIEANEFASSSLINQQAYDEFIKNGNFSISAINKFARQNEVANYIVVGRLQKDKYFGPSEFNNVKTDYLVSRNEKFFDL